MSETRLSIGAVTEEAYLLRLQGIEAEWDEDREIIQVRNNGVWTDRIDNLTSSQEDFRV